jgi:hypothetical protein
MQDFSKDPVPSLRPSGGGAAAIGWIVVVAAWLTVPMCVSGATSHDDATQQASAALWFGSAFGCLVLMIIGATGKSERAGLQAGLAIVGLVIAFLAGIKSSSMTHGRQLLIRRRPVMPSRRRAIPASDDRQAVAATLWIRNADAEWVSVAAFSKLSLELLELGAPSELVRECHTAALEEIAHTRLCLDVASGLHRGAADAGEAPIPALSSLRGGRTHLVDVATESLVQGAFLERVSAEVARELGDCCDNTPIRAALQRISADEQQHAEHSFQIVLWCLQQAGATLGPTLQRALAAAGQQPPDPSEIGADGAYEDLGIPGAARMAAVRARVLAEVGERLRTALAACAPAPQALSA